MTEPQRIAPWLESIVGGLKVLPSYKSEAVEPPTPEELLARQRAEFDRLLPTHYRWAAFGAPEFAARCADSRAVAGARSDRTGWVVIMGPPGAGKTSLGVSLLREWTTEGLGSPRFVHAYRLGYARIQHRAGDGEAAEVERAMVGLALLDDVGSERDTANNAVPDVLFERHACERPTILTTGLDASQLATRYGGGIARRILERATVIRLGVKR